MKVLTALLSLIALPLIICPKPALANAGALLRDLRDFSSNAEHSQGNDGHVIIDCWRQLWNGGEIVIAEWRLHSYRGPFVYVSGAVSFSESVTPFPLNSSPVGFSVPWTTVVSGSEELVVDHPISTPVVFATITGYVELGIERGAIIPTSAVCPRR